MITPLTSLLRQAAELILTYYHDPDRWQVDLKSDDSPVTAADKAANEVIVSGLRDLTPDYAILAEEGPLTPYEERRDRYCWFVDPVDGTKEFLARNGEFVICLGLCDPSGKTILGMMLQPTSGHLYYAEKGKGSYFVKHSDAIPELLRVSDKSLSSPGQRVLTSRSHPQPGFDDLLNQLSAPEVVTYGSALKFCRLAQGGAEWYPRTGLMHDWDMIAGHLIVTEAGGSVKRMATGQEPIYNQESYYQPPFMASSHQEWELDF